MLDRRLVGFSFGCFQIMGGRKKSQDCFPVSAVSAKITVSLILGFSSKSHGVDLPAKSLCVLGEIVFERNIPLKFIIRESISQTTKLDHFWDRRDEINEKEILQRDLESISNEKKYQKNMCVYKNFIMEIT